MPFLLLVFLSLACLPDPGRDWPEPPWDGSPWLAVVLTALTVGLSTLTAGWLARRVRLALSPDYFVRESALARYDRGRARHQYLVFGLYVLALLVFGWGSAVGKLWSTPSRVLPFAELIVLAPFLVSLLLSWACFYDAERAQWGVRHLEEGLSSALSGREGSVETAAAFTAVPHPAFHMPESLASRWGYVLFQARQRLALVFIPLGLLLVQKELARTIPDDAWLRWETPLHLLGFVAVLGAFAVMPWMLRLVLGLTPMPDGTLKRRLLDTARRLGFRCSGLLLWNTRSGMANAMVVGILPWPRYVIFTDRLLEEFTPDEVEAVLGHEIGHIRHRHMPYYLAFLLASIFVVALAMWRFFPQATEPEKQLPASSAAAEVMAPIEEPGEASKVASFFTLEHHRYLKMVPAVAAMLGYIFIVFGFLSRRCERQADVFGCVAVSCGRADCEGHEDGRPTGESRRLCPTGVRTFIRALEKVALVNGLSRDRPGWLQSWQHSTIGKRVDFLERVLVEPTVEKKFQRRVLLLQCGVMLTLGFVLTGLILF